MNFIVSSGETTEEYFVHFGPDSGTRGRTCHNRDANPAGVVRAVRIWLEQPLGLRLYVDAFTQRLPSNSNASSEWLATGWMFSPDSRKWISRSSSVSQVVVEMNSFFFSPVNDFRNQRQNKTSNYGVAPQVYDHAGSETVWWRKLMWVSSLQAASSSPPSSSRSSSPASFPSCPWAGATWSAACARSSASGAAAAAAMWWRRLEVTWSTVLSRDSTSPPPAVRPSLPRSPSSFDPRQTAVELCSF